MRTLNKNTFINIVKENMCLEYAIYIENIIPNSENFIVGEPKFIYLNKNGKDCITIFRHKLRSAEIPFYNIVLFIESDFNNKIFEHIPQNCQFQITSQREVEFESPYICKKVIEHIYTLDLNNIKPLANNLKEQYEILVISENSDKYEDIIIKCNDNIVISQWNSFKNNESAKIYAIIKGETLICYCDLIGDELSKGIGHIYTAPLYRNKGFASALLNEIIISNNNLNEIEYVVNNNNLYSQKVAINNGFKKKLTVYLYEGKKL